MHLVEPTKRRSRRRTTARRARGATPPAVSPRPAPTEAASARLNLRLLNRLTLLTPEQALVLAADLVDAVLARHAAGRPLGGFGAEHVWVTADGRVSLEAPRPGGVAGRASAADPAGAGEHPAGAVAPPAPARVIEVPGQRVAGDTAHEPDGADRAADLRSVHALLAGLAARATHQPERPGADTEEVRGAALDLASVATQLTGDVAEAAVRLRAAAAEVGPEVHAELAALVAVTAGSVLAPPPVVRVAPPVAAGGTAEGTGPRGRAVEVLRREAERGWTAVARLGRWALALAVLLAVLALEVFLLGDRISADLAALRAAGQSSDRGPVDLTAPLEPVAPAASGAVTGVDLRALARCAPGGGCQVRVLVRLVPQALPRRVQWHYLVQDRCSGAERRVEGGSVTVAPGGREAAVVGQLAVPPGRALAVTAVVEEPARAASAAVLVPAGAGC
jgi:hypothetical protein